MITIIFLLLLLFFAFASGFFSLSQIALFSLSSSELRLYKVDADSRKQLIARLLSRPRELLVTLMICDIGANILIQNMAANLLEEFASWLLKVGVPLVITLFFGEIFPKTIALPHNTSISYHVAPTIDFLQRLLGPIQTLMTRMTAPLSRVLFFFLKKEREISKEELHLALKTSEHHGILNREEAELIDGYLSLTDYTVKERMHPRDEIVFYDIEEPLSKLIYLFSERECSKVPICKGDLQNMLGTLSATDFFLARNAIQEGKDLLPYLKKPNYVPETILARTLLRQFLQSENKMGIVVDEYGAISGLITEEDLFEVVIGEIIDKRDEKSRYTPAGDNVIITSGKFELSEFEELFHISLPSENNVVTIGGWLTEQLGEIPKSGTKFVWQNFLFQILAADSNRVRRVYIRKLSKKAEKTS